MAGSYNDVLHVLRSGAASEVMLFEPAKSENGLYTVGLYLQDTWRMGNRLTMNAGVRFDHYRNFLPEQDARGRAVHGRQTSSSRRLTT